MHHVCLLKNVSNNNNNNNNNNNDDDENLCVCVYALSGKIKFYYLYYSLRMKF